MRNRFPGVCYRCGEPVAAGAGHFERKKFDGVSKWRLQHADCCLANRSETNLKYDPVAAEEAKRRISKGVKP